MATQIEFDDKRFIELLGESEGDFDIEAQLRQTPSLLAFYGQQVAEWVYLSDWIKGEIGFKSSELAEAFRDSFDGAKAPAQGIVDAHVGNHEDIKSLTRKLHKANREKGFYKNAVETLNTRVATLQTISSNRRAELEKSNLRSKGLSLDPDATTSYALSAAGVNPGMLYNTGGYVNTKLTDAERAKAQAVIAGLSSAKAV